MLGLGSGFRSGFGSGVRVAPVQVFFSFVDATLPLGWMDVNVVL